MLEKLKQQSRRCNHFFPLKLQILSLSFSHKHTHSLSFSLPSTHSLHPMCEPVCLHIDRVSQIESLSLSHMHSHSLIHEQSLTHSITHTTHMHTRTHTPTRTHMHTHMHTRTHTPTRTHMHTCTVSPCYLSLSLALFLSFPRRECTIRLIWSECRKFSFLFQFSHDKNCNNRVRA